MTIRLTCPSVPVSWGELLDKITILAIKRGRIEGAEARGHVEREYRLLAGIAADVLDDAEIAALIDELTAVNTDLWQIEDAIRGCEAEGEFGSRFIDLARAVYRRNDERAAVKREINRRLRSELVEEKSYASAALAPAGPALDRDRGSRAIG